MDIFKSMNQTKVADFSVFKSKKKNPVATEEQKEAVAEQNPVPQKESVAGRMTEKTVSPIKEEVPVEQAEKGDSVPEEFVQGRMKRITETLSPLNSRRIRVKKQRLNWRPSWKLQRVIFCLYFPLSDI